METSTELQAYRLELANGQVWQLVAASNLRDWLARLSTVLGLRTCSWENCPRLLFVQQPAGPDDVQLLLRSLPPALAAPLPRDGWQARCCSWLQLWSHPECSDLLYNLAGQPPFASSEEEHWHQQIMNMWFALHPIYRRAQTARGLGLHAALVEHEGQAMLIAAPGGTGKSTCCRRLPPPWRALCDDEVLVVPAHGRLRVHPFPTWSDFLFRRHEHGWDVQDHRPLSAIFFLEQAPDDEVVPLGQGQAALRICQAAVQVRHFCAMVELETAEGVAFKQELFGNACGMARQIPSFTLRASLTGRFWEVMLAALARPAPGACLELAR